MTGVVRAVLRPHWALALRVVAWSALLALLTATYGALVGPLLRALFGGELAWPAMLAPHLPPPPRAETLRLWLPALLVGSAVLKGVAQQRQTAGAARLGQRVLVDLRGRLHARILGLPPDAVALIGIGQLQSRAMHDVEAIERWAVEGTAIRLRDGAQVIALLALCLVIEWRLALVVFGIYPLVFLPIARIGRRLRRAAGAAQAARGDLQVELDDQLRRLAWIQLSASDAAARQRFASLNQAVAHARVRQVDVRSLAPPLNEIVGALALAGTLIYAGQRISAGTLAAEHVLSFFVAVLMLYQPVKGIVRAQAIVEPGRAAWARMGAILDHPAHLPAEGGRPPPDAPPTLRFEGLCVQRGGRAVIAGLDGVVPAGSWAAIEGPNGAGKTTLAWTLARLLDASAGQVRVDGVPLRDLDPVAWRARIGWMTQRPLLGRGSLEANLRSGAEADMEYGARLAGLAPIVARLPAGWQTVLGDDGAGLSGGEQQRVALARALARRPSVLILDEPTAHLDAAARADLIERVQALRGQMTILLITHDPALAAQADQRIRLA